MSVDYYVVLDFEATCQENVKIFPQEVIELPSVLIDANTKTIIDEIQIYVKPLVHTTLSDFCTELTGIQQEWVDNAITFDKALEQYETWLDSHGLLNGEKTFVFITCGDWDFGIMFQKQMDLIGKDIHQRYTNWVNIKHIYNRQYNVKAPGMAGMLNYLNLSLDGRHHSGIDDCRNIAKIVLRLIEDGATIQNTSSKRSKKGKLFDWQNVLNGAITVGSPLKQNNILTQKQKNKVNIIVNVEEDSNTIQTLCDLALLPVIHVPLNKAYLSVETAPECQEAFQQILTALENGNRVYIQSDGLERSTLIAYSILRSTGNSHGDTLEMLDDIARALRHKLDKHTLEFTKVFWN